MDRQGGGPPDKRSAAYESIFGRPSASHHQYTRAPPSASNYAPFQQTVDYGAPNYYYAQQQYDPRYDAYAQAAQQQQYAQQAYASSAYRQQAYYDAQYAQHVQQQQASQAQYSYGPTSYTNLTAQDQYERSIGSSSHSTGVIVPQPHPQESVDPGTEVYMRQGMTPAQAYQAKVYSNGTTSQRNSQEHPSVTTSARASRTISTVSEAKLQDGSRESLGQRVPQLGFEPPDSRLDLDFLGEGKVNGKDGGIVHTGQYSGNAGGC